MPALQRPIPPLRQSLVGGELALAEALFFPEVLFVDSASMTDRQDRALRELVAKLSAMQPAGEWDRRSAGGVPDVRAVTVELTPPKDRAACWSQPLVVDFHALVWRHGDDAIVA